MKSAEMIPVRAMVMAAGAGTRLRPLTESVPKPMVPIANRPVLEYTVENLRRHGITEIVFNLHSHPELIRNHFGDGSAWGVQIHYSHEPRLLGTAGGVKHVENFLKRGTFLVMSGDGLTTIDLTALLRFHRERRSFATLATKPVDTRFDYGVTMTNARHRITRFVEKPNWSDVFSNEVNTGIYVFEPEVLAMIPTKPGYDFGHQLWPRLLKSRKPIYGYPMASYWCDVGSLAEYRHAQMDFLDGTVGLRPPGREIRRGIWVEDGARIEKGAHLEAPCLIGAGSRIRRHARIGAHTIIGRRTTIGAGSVLKNAILWDDIIVHANVHLENCIMTSRVQIHESITVFDGVFSPTSHVKRR